MKKILLSIAVACVGLYFTTNIHYTKYRIVGVVLQRVIINEDSAINNKRMYVLRFDVEGCSPRLTFLKPAYEPGVFGSVDSIEEINIKDAANKNIIIDTQNGLSQIDVTEKSKDANDVNNFSLVPGISLERLVSAINNNNMNGHHFVVDQPYYFYISTEYIPKAIEIRFFDRKIKGFVNSEPIILENM